MRTYLLTIALLVLPSCIAVPRTEVSYDPQCQIQFRQMRLDVKTSSGGGPSLVNCSGQACLPYLALVGGISLGSMVVSGSIVIVGNTVFWLEKQGRCLLGPPPLE